MSAIAFGLYVSLFALAFAICAVIALPGELAPAIALLFGGAP